MDSFIEDNAPCQWMYTLDEKNCKGRNSMRKVMLAAAITYGILALKEICTIIYLRRNKNRKNWSSLEYILVCAILFCSLRSFDNFVVAYNLFPDAIIFRVSLFAISWIPGSIGMYVYLAGIFRAIPKLSFHRITSNKSTLWMPNSKQVKPTMWALSLITSIGLILSSILAGYFLREGEKEKMIIAFSVQMSFFLFTGFVCLFSFFYYGRTLVSLTRESLKLAGVNERKDFDRKRFDIHIHKMKTINYVFVGICLLFSSFLIPIIIFYKQTMMRKFIINILYFLTCNVISEIVVAIIGFAIVYTDFRSRNLETTTEQCSTMAQSEYYYSKSDINSVNIQ